MREQPATTSRVKAGFCGSPASPIFRILAERFDLWFDQVLAEARREGQAEAWQAGWAARASRPHLGMHECIPAPDHINPYSADRIENGAGQ